MSYLTEDYKDFHRWLAEVNEPKREQDYIVGKVVEINPEKIEKRLLHKLLSGYRIYTKLYKKHKADIWLEYANNCKAFYLKKKGVKK